MHLDSGVVQLLTSVAAKVEEQVDAELQRLEALTEDDLEEVRRKRLEALKRGAAKRQEWAARGHGTYREVPGEKARRRGGRRARRGR